MAGNISQQQQEINHDIDDVYSRLDELESEEINISEEFYRPTEVLKLNGNGIKIETILKWTPETQFYDLVKKMVAHDLKW